MLQHLLDVLAEPPAPLRGQAELGQRLQHLGVRLELDALARADGVEHGADRALRDEARVELFERAGGGVAGVGKGLLAGGGELGVQRLEILRRHVGLAAHFEQRGRVLQVQLQRDRADGAEIGGDVVAILRRRRA